MARYIPGSGYDFMYLTGASNDRLRRLAEGDLYGRLGLMVSLDTPYLASHIPSYSAWALDNSCFAHAGEFDGDDFLFLLARTIGHVDGAYESCRFAVAPDVFDPTVMRGDPRATIDRSLPWFKQIRDCGAPPALVYQDGMEWMEDEEIPWDEFDVAFIGGGNAFKLGYPSRVDRGICEYNVTRISWDTYLWADLISRTLTRGKEVHVGRVNSWARVCFSIEAGATTVDGTTATRGPEAAGCIETWLRRLIALEKQRTLFDMVA